MASKSALDGSRSNMFNMDPEALIIADDPQHPLYDGDRTSMALDEGLVANIKAIGVIEPVVVAKVDGQYVVVAGRQRIRAAREANVRLKAEGQPQRTVRTIIQEGQPQQLFAMMVAENEARISDTPLAKARKLQRLLGMGYTEDQAAVIFKVTKQCISNWRTLLDLAKPVQRAVDSGRLAATAAAKLANLAPDDQVAALTKLDGQPETSTGRTKKVSGRKVAAAAGGTSKPATKELKAKLAEVEGRKKKSERDQGVIDALRWVLGLDEEMF